MNSAAALGASQMVSTALHFPLAQVLLIRVARRTTKGTTIIQSVGFNLSNSWRDAKSTIKPQVTYGTSDRTCMNVHGCGADQLWVSKLIPEEHASGPHVARAIQAATYDQQKVVNDTRQRCFAKHCCFRVRRPIRQAYTVLNKQRRHNLRLWVATCHRITT